MPGGQSSAAPISSARSAPDLNAPEPRIASTPEDQVDHDGATVFATSLARTHRPSEASTSPGGEPLVLAAMCHLQHANPPEASQCRLCGGPVQQQSPRLVNRPVLAVLRPSSGSAVDIDRAVLIGRSPTATRVAREQLPRLLTVPSPSHDISRTHVQVAPDGWELAVTDLHSTNGTTLVRPGAEIERERLTPGETVAVEIGNILDLGDGVTIAIEKPA